MFKSFFPKPGPFFYFCLYLVAAGRDLLAGGRRRLAAAGHRSIAKCGDQRGALLVAQLSGVLRLLSVLRRRVCTLLVCLLPASLAVLVDSRHVAHHLRHLVSGGSRGGDQRLVCASFYDLIQSALATPHKVSINQFYHEIGIFLGIALIAVIIGVMNNFFVSHYVFPLAHGDERTLYGPLAASAPYRRRRAACAGRYHALCLHPWKIWGVSFINAVMTLIAFLPVLVTLSEHVPDLPIVGHLPYGLVIAAIVWSLMGTGLLAVVGIKLPGLEFKNQRVEAAYRKELVYGEDDETRATPPTVRELFSAVRRNYFRLYFHYMYFNIARILYLQVDNVFGLFLLFPSIVAGTITLGLMTQITNVFGQVRGSFQYLISSWTTLVELMSIYKRLRSFERELDGKPLQEAIPTLR